MIRTHQPAGGFIAVALGETLTYATHQLQTALISTPLAQQLQCVTFGTLARKVYILGPHAAVFINPFRTKIMRGEQA
jgi:hypothetical protein